MRHKRLKLSILLMLGLGQSLLQAQTMYVKEKNGAQTNYALSSIRKMTFSGGNVYIQKTDNSTGVYASIGLRYLNFTDLTQNIMGQPKLLDNANWIMYPNPIDDILNIDLSCENGEGNISILSIEGKVMQTLTTSNNNLVTLNLSHLPKGIYLCHYSNKFENKIVKIIKQ